jgi:hypothetical protein
MRSNAHRPHPQACDLAYPSCAVGTVVIFWTAILESMPGSAAFSHSGQPENCEINSLSIQALQLAVARVSAYPLREAPMVSDIQGKIAIACFASMFLCVRAAAQEGHYGVGHERWHKDFYLKLNRNDGKGTCCNLVDCRPTQSRMVGDHYEVKVDGEWTPVPNDKINNVVAPDGGAHVCAPRQTGPNKGVLFCVVLPPEG